MARQTAALWTVGTVGDHRYLFDTEHRAVAELLDDDTEALLLSLLNAPEHSAKAKAPLRTWPKRGTRSRAVLDQFTQAHPISAARACHLANVTSGGATVITSALRSGWLAERARDARDEGSVQGPLPRLLVLTPAGAAARDLARDAEGLS